MKRVVEQQEAEVTVKRKHLDQSGKRVVEIPFTETSRNSSSQEAENAGTTERMELE